MNKSLESAAFDLASIGKRAHIANEEFDAVLMFKEANDLARFKAELMRQLDHTLITPEQRMALWDNHHITIAGVTFKLRHKAVLIGHADPDPQVSIERARDALNFRGTVYDAESNLRRALTELLITVTRGSGK